MLFNNINSYYIHIMLFIPHYFIKKDIFFNFSLIHSCIKTKRYLYEILFLFVENTDLNIASIRNTLVYQSSNLTPWTTREIFMYPCTRLSDGIRIEMYGIISLLTDFFLSKNIHTVHLCFGNHVYIKY